MIQMLNGLLSFNVSAVFASVNITIWNGTTIENTHKKYIPFDSIESTLVIYQAHIEQHIMISATDVTVIRTLYPNDLRKSISVMPYI